MALTNTTRKLKQKLVMKTKIVIHGSMGSDENKQTFLLALELKPIENKIHAWLIPSNTADNDASSTFSTTWINNASTEMPPEAKFSEHSLSASQSILPQGFQTDQQDFVSRTQTEWIFIVLSTKLFQRYQDELNELREQVEQLSSYSKPKWEAMKVFWSKVQNQINEKNLFKDHSLILKNHTNNLFAHLKKLRSAQDAVFEKVAQENYEKLILQLTALELVAKEGNKLDETFKKLKQLQSEFKNTQLTRSLRSQFWEKIDAVFKEVKLKRNPESNPQDRLSRRIEGLIKAIAKMQRSIDKDEKELQSQTKRLNASDLSQLENQLREVRAKLIRERIESKSEKLSAMHQTLKDLNTKQERAKQQQKKELEKRPRTESLNTEPHLEQVVPTNQDKQTEAKLLSSAMSSNNTVTIVAEEEE